ncbi:CLUMA_CG005642, isoform A [Clunio marinus]|uniref:CLUMA_CG005642, isoform A n=1 Tax=Clunio marinus TaxID=568069 RepID=A0A1J1HZU3_9DIPT|nr:CLUMA_CG005642, isoform A [Clunio marinus]
MLPCDHSTYFSYIKFHLWKFFNGQQDSNHLASKRNEIKCKKEERKKAQVACQFHNAITQIIFSLPFPILMHGKHFSFMPHRRKKCMKHCYCVIEDGDKSEAIVRFWNKLKGDCQKQLRID